MSPEQLDALDHWAVLQLVLLAAFSLLLLCDLLRGLGPFLWIAFRAPRVAREPPLWGFAEVVPCLVAWFAAQLVVAVLLGPLADEISRSALDLAMITSASFLTCAFIFVVVKRLLGQPLASLGLVRTSWWNVLPTLVSYLLLFFPMQLVALGWNLALYELFRIEPELQVQVENIRDLVRERDVLGVAFFAISAIVVAPVFEEILFRGVVYGWLRRYGVLPAALVSGLVFGLVHFSLSTLVPLWLLGTMLAYVYERTGSLWMPIVFHCVFNAVTVGRLIQIGL